MTRIDSRGTGIRRRPSTQTAHQHLLPYTASFPCHSFPFSHFFLYPIFTALQFLLSFCPFFSHFLRSFTYSFSCPSFPDLPLLSYFLFSTSSLPRPSFSPLPTFLVLTILYFLFILSFLLSSSYSPCPLFLPFPSLHSLLFSSLHLSTNPFPHIFLLPLPSFLHSSFLFLTLLFHLSPL